ncbi:uncharacterized protein [Drosophila bipectinata]|uniref:uncharacterized protein n=1 Tax=Drosophila bipectinata TaxID=42026 RepID=UPI001C8950F5|nr:uncharacterized protein LOC108125972 [Drosophila bipectinata]
MKQSIALLFLVVCLSRTLADPRYYDNYTVYRVYIKNSHQQKIIDQLLEQPDNYNLWHRTVREVHLMVNPRVQSEFRKIMLKNHIKTEVLIPNVQALIENQTGYRRI